MLNSKEIIPIKPNQHHGKVSSLTMMLKMFTALVLISSNGARHYLVKTAGPYNYQLILFPPLSLNYNLVNMKICMVWILMVSFHI